ncbi:MAG: YqaJ viral recombinase family protein, partial [Lachnospiraceae bacterium]|nr:YqaJ viral recombinase family protein [Lachnospiraceae bacterium]
MCRILAKTKDMPREKWLELRKQGIGGSDAGAVCGVNPYSSPMKVFQDKTGDETEEIDNEAV